MVIQSKDWTLKNTHSKGGMKLSKTHEIGFKDCRVGFLLWLHQVCPDSCTCSLLIRVRHYGWERPWGQLCHVLLGEMDGVGPRVVIRQQDQEEEVCELWLQYWEERLLQPHVLCPLPSRKSGSTWRARSPSGGARMAPLSEALLWCLSSDKLAPRADGHFRDGSYLPLWTWGWR